MDEKYLKYLKRGKYADNTEPLHIIIEVIPEVIEEIIEPEIIDVIVEATAEAVEELTEIEILKAKLAALEADK